MAGFGRPNYFRFVIAAGLGTQNNFSFANATGFRVPSSFLFASPGGSRTPNSFPFADNLLAAAQNKCLITVAAGSGGAKQFPNPKGNPPMPNAGSLSAIAVGHLTQTVDSERAAGDRFKLPEFLRANLDEKLAALEASDSHTALTESDRTGGSSKAREALDQMETLLRDGYNGIKAIRSATISDGERMGVFTTYGWVGGKLGTFNDARIIGLARLAVREDVGITNPEWLYDPELVQAIKDQLAIFDGI